MASKEFKEAVKKLRDPNYHPEREGEYWTEDEIERLREMFDEHVGITDIAITLKRSEAAVYQQIEKQDLFDRKANPKRRKHSERLPQCFRPLCMNDPACCPYFDKCMGHTNNKSANIKSRGNLQGNEEKMRW